MTLQSQCVVNIIANFDCQLVLIAHINVCQLCMSAIFKNRLSRTLSCLDNTLSTWRNHETQHFSHGDDKLRRYLCPMCTTYHTHNLCIVWCYATKVITLKFIWPDVTRLCYNHVESIQLSIKNLFKYFNMWSARFINFTYCSEGENWPFLK